MILNKEKFINAYKEVIHQNTSPIKLGLAIAMGVFIGVTPTYGFQTALAILLAFILRLNKPAAILGTMIAIPWLYPIWIYCDFTIGNWLVGNHSTIEFPPPISIDFIYSIFYKLAIGSIFFGIAIGSLFFTVAYFFTKSYRKRKYDSAYSLAE